MTLHLLQIVSALDDDADVRLDLNDGDVWTCVDFSAPAPRLRRSMGANMMRDGINVSSSNYGERVISASLRVKSSTFEAATSEQQTLARELDRTDNWLKLQLTALDKPIFFRLFRSDMSSIRKADAEDVYELTVELLADSLGLGELETLGPFTVNNDPAAGSNGLFFDVTGVIGDVSSPAIIADATRNVGLGVLAVRQHGVPADLTWWTQAEDAMLLIDTADPGGGPDAAMSGTGTNNFVTTDFATTTTMAPRVQWSIASGLTDAQLRALRGTFRAYAVVRRSDNTSDINVQVGRQAVGYEQPAVALPKNTGRQLVDMGLVSFGDVAKRTGYGLENSLNADAVMFSAEITSGSGTLDWDFVALIPADESLLTWTAETVSTSFDFVVDGYNDEVWMAVSSAALFDGSVNPEDSESFNVSGGFPSLVPNQTNRLFFLEAGASAAMVKGDSSVMTVYYYPRYLYVRPSAT